ncbi:MAG: VWA domain-containing protein [Chitinophagaceae bacterium]|nr:VWA domain-containing protein [Chitinophagaceae bacterium]
MLHFSRPEGLILLVLIPLLIFAYVYVVQWKKRAIRRIGDEKLVKLQIAQYSPARFRFKFILILLATTLCVFAITGLVAPDPSQKLIKSGKDIVVALDVSKSMLASDVQPDRLERAKQVVTKVINTFPDDRIGLVVFAGRAYLQMPLTIDHDAAKMFLSSASPDNIPVQGTALSKALEMSYASFDMKSKSYKTVLLISDGEDHEPDAVKTAANLAKEGIMINTVGIGSPAGAPIPDPETGQYKTDVQGRMVISKLNEQTLSEIAAAAHGVYKLYNNTDDVVSAIKKQLDTISDIPVITESSYLSFKQYYWYFLLGAFVLLVAEAFVSEKIKLRKPAMAVVFFMLIGYVPSYGQSANKIITEGNKAFREERFNDAEKEYLEALEKQGKNSDVAHFNLGNTYFRKNEADKAVAAYDKTIEETHRTDIKQQAYYNKGVAYQQAQKIQESITAYKNALLLDPNDEAARQNLQRLLKQQKQQQQESEKKKEDKKEQKQKPQDQKKPQAKNPAKITREEAENKLKALLENEKALQEKMKKVSKSASLTPEKDW